MLGGRRAAHGRQRGPATAEDRLRSLGSEVPQIRSEVVHALAHERAHRVLPRALATVVVVVVVAYVATQLLRPVPAPVFRSALSSSSLTLAGAAPPLPWPSSGSAAMELEPGALLGTSGTSSAVPIASIAKVLTAFVVLQGHPLASGASGPSIAVTSDVVADYQSGAAAQESEVPVAAGESLTELQALEGLLLVGANDMATLLAEWDAGSVSAFVSKMTATAHELGLHSVRVTDPSGLDPGTVSSPADLLSLAQAAMAVPAFAQIVGMGEVTLPLAGTVYNTDADLGSDGIVGIKTGSDTAAGGCFLFAAQNTVAGRSLTLVGVVLGQATATPTATALSVAESLVSSAVASASPIALVAPGQVLGHVVAAWGPSVAVEAASSPTLVAWPGLKVPVTIRALALPLGFANGRRVGVLEVATGGQHIDTTVRAAGSLAGPSIWWRLTRF